MAYTPCTNDTPSMNAAKDCINPPYEGLYEMAIMIAKSDIAAAVRGSDDATKNHVASITLKEGATVTIVEAQGENAWTDTTESYDPATRKFNKTVTGITPINGAGFASSFVEPAVQNRDGYVFILQRKDNHSDRAFPIIGLEKGAIGQTADLDYNSTDTASCYQISWTETNAPSAEIDLYVPAGEAGTDYEATLAVFEALVAKAV